MVKPRLGLAGGVLSKANCQGVPIITQPRKERKIREHNTDMTETRAARVEQNTRREAEPEANHPHQGARIITQPRKERNIREHHTDMTEK